ncbi:endopeptidase La [Alloalcanivorax venustensis]|uniref:endopeptidase La n=1 Tax=Alloalcanivorax TaxID=3020832 RepID=UPI00079C491A|nr:MAG: DNA-binding protein [Alcanivorax sp. Nap_24]MAK23124.1 endopeptidase La [Alcanivorax sp.]MEA3259227.1 endopeptidase La [Pseudomonadota bacterium]SMO89678.1 ATP-dependent proteinase. Serine peptidase. MEROPS family S16 [Alcanivorax sp. DSM 26295]MAQ34356.1 endopeptidase La [Alcanivorax sp.]
MLKDIPLLPLRDVVVYPHMVIPLFVGREKSIAALEAAMASDKQIMLVAQRNASDDDPAESDIYRVGTVSTILQMLKLPDGTVKVLVEGGARGHISKARFGEEGGVADVRELDNQMPSESEQDALSRSLLAKFEEYVKLSKKVAPEIMNSVSSIDEVSRLADTISAHLQLKLEEKQDVLEMVDVRERVEHLVALMESDMDVLKVEKRIRGRVKKQMEKSQREYYLNEQMKAIQKELGDLDDSGNELEDLEKKIDNSGMPKDAKEKSKNELNKLRMMSPMSAEATVVRSYLDWMTSVPWKKRSRVRHDLAHAKEILDQDHYGLEEVKERILEFLAVQSRVGKVKGPVLCLVGPPGVGKTSLGQSVARATNRKFVRMALGGVRDEAEIRGHRRTYIGSLPGKVIQKLSKVGVRNPLFLLDEVDKMGMDMRGDPASALLEVLDPEQNHTFSDHYLEVDYNLSETLFICTSNSMNIPAPLLDRMEVIRLPGYTEDEKINIASQYLIPKQIKSNGLRENELVLDEKALQFIVRHYTRESGVRGLEREISKICRKVVKENLLEKENRTITLTPENIDHYLGVRKYDYGRAEEKDQIGQVTGLAWTSVGGELLTIEGVSTPGKGRVTTTGSLGDVMQESIQAAWTVVKSRSGNLGIRRRQLERNDVHIHVPEGATPKDGPSAGIGMCTAMVSVLTGIPVRADVAMTGEITLRGQVLAIGGLKEKLLAAHRGGIKTVLIPQENERDLKEIPDKIKEALDIRPVKWIDQVLELALTHTPTPLSEAEVEEDLALAEEKAQKGSERPSTH